MQFNSFSAFQKSNQVPKAQGPIALIFAEDETELSSTLRHHKDIGFKTLFVFMPHAFSLDQDVADFTIRIDMEHPTGLDMIAMINEVSAAYTDAWIYYCFNAEYLMFPFCETRSIGEMLRFHTEEHRTAMLTYVVDIYAENLHLHHNAVSIDTAMLDKAGYYALARRDQDNKTKERQLDFYGGLRWRYEEHVPEAKRKIDRVSIFKATRGVTLRPDFTLTDEEMNTYSCDWHSNLTAAICSFRTAKALKTNAGSTYDIKTFKWANSVRFEWHSRQLMDLGLMEPGQWF